MLFTEGDEALHAYEVIQGRIGIYILVSGKQEKVGVIGEGEFIGEMGMVSSALRSATAIAETKVSLQVFSKEDFEARLQDSDPVVRKVLEGSMDRIRNDHSKLEASVQIRTLYRLLSRFLPNYLVDKLKSHESPTDKLGELLAPRTQKIAVLQADIRGFSELVAQMDGESLMEVLSQCYGPVVDFAQHKGYVKLIGDCIFFFTVDGLEEERTACDIALDMVELLHTSCEMINNLSDNKVQLHFGVGVHYGDAVVGNISIDNMIDYTCLGSVVNKAARLEESTKILLRKELISRNSVVLSEEAAANLKKYRGLERTVIDLVEEDVKVRNFPETKTVHIVDSRVMAGLVSSDRFYFL